MSNLIPLDTGPFRSAVARGARIFGFIALIVAILFVPLLAFGQTDPGLELDPGVLITALVKAVQGHQWSTLGVIVFLALIWVARLYGAKLLPWLGTDDGGTWLVFGTVIAGGLAPAALGGTPITWEIVRNAFLAAATLGGSWAMARRLLRPFVPLVAKIPKVGPILSTALAFFTGAQKPSLAVPPTP
jgi:hypothetical protein